MWKRSGSDESRLLIPLIFCFFIFIAFKALSIEFSVSSKCESDSLGSGDLADILTCSKLRLLKNFPGEVELVDLFTNTAFRVFTCVSKIRMLNVKNRSLSFKYNLSVIVFFEFSSHSNFVFEHLFKVIVDIFLCLPVPRLIRDGLHDSGLFLYYGKHILIVWYLILLFSIFIFIY